MIVKLASAQGLYLLTECAHWFENSLFCIIRAVCVADKSWEENTELLGFFYSNIMCSNISREISMSANCCLSLKFNSIHQRKCMQLCTNLQRKSSGILYKLALIMIWTGGWRVCSANFDQLASVNLFTITQKRASSSANGREVCHIKDLWFKRYSDPNVRPSVKVKFGFEGLTHAGFHIFSVTFY